MRIGVAISTIGKADKLDLVFASLELQDTKPHQIIVVDQSENTRVAATVAAWTDRLPLKRIVSPRGASLGRNTGWQALDDCDVVAFPDDDISLEPGTLTAVLHEFEVDEQLSALSGRLIGSGQRVAFVGGREYLNERTVWTKAIEATTFYRMNVLHISGGFDIDLGVGCATQWQSGEGTDLLLRVMHLGPILFEPAIVVREHQDPISQKEYLRKVRKYARGTGRVYRTRYNKITCILVMIRPLLAVALYIAQGRRKEAQAKWQAAVGRLEGMTLSATARPAS